MVVAPLVQEPIQSLPTPEEEENLLRRLHKGTPLGEFDEDSELYVEVELVQTVDFQSPAVADVPLDLP